MWTYQDSRSDLDPRPRAVILRTVGQLGWYLDDLQVYVVRVGFPVERQRFGLFPVDTEAVEVVVGERQPHLRMHTHRQLYIDQTLHGDDEIAGVDNDGVDFTEVLYCIVAAQGGSVAEWLACAEGPGFNSQLQTVHTHRASVHRAAKLVARGGSVAE